MLGLVALVSVGGFLLAALGSGRPSTPAGHGEKGAAGLSAMAARANIARIENNGNPPQDIVASLVVPAESTVTSTIDSDRGIGPFDRSLLFSVPASVSSIGNFYKNEFAAHGWKIAGIDATADGKGKAIYATRESEDGFYWEVGAVIEPASESISPALAGGDATVTSDLKLRLFEVDDSG